MFKSRIPKKRYTLVALSCPNQIVHTDTDTDADIDVDTDTDTDADTDRNRDRQTYGHKYRQIQAQMISTDSETYAARSHSLFDRKSTSSPRVLPQIDRRSRHRSPSLNLVRSFFLGWRIPNLITGLSRGEHPINRLGPKKLSRTVADLVYSRP